MSLNKSFPLTFEITDFSLGWDNINKPTTLDMKTFSDIKNFNLTPRRGLEKRGGITALYGASAGASTDVTNLYEYKAPDGNDYVLAAISTKMRAYYNATWNDLKIGLTAGQRYSFETHRGLCYGVNGVDDNFKLYTHPTMASYAVGISPPLGAPAIAVASAGSATQYINHDETNEDHIGELRQHGDRTMLAQSFTLNQAIDVTKVVLKLKKVGSPTGNLIVEIHSDQEGTQVGTDSDNISVAGLDGQDFAEVDIAFTGTAPSLKKDTLYYLVVKSSHTIADSAYVVVGFDEGGTYSNGQYFEVDTASPGSADYTLYDNVDLGFEVWGNRTDGTNSVEYGALETGTSRRLRASTIVYLAAQGFELSANSKISSIDLPLKRRGAESDTFWVEIHDTANGVGMSATKGASTNMITNGASDDVEALDIPEDREWVTFTFTTDPSITANTAYYIVLYTDGPVPSTNEYISWTLDDSGYGDGTGYVINTSFSWTDLENDYSFKVSGYPSAVAKGGEYDLDKVVQKRGLRETADQGMIAQSFKVSEDGSVSSVDIYMAKTGSPGANDDIWVEIHDDRTGTSVDINDSQYQKGQASDTVDISDTLSAFPTYGWVTFTFSGTKPSLKADNNYYVVIYGDFTVNDEAFVNIALDVTPPGYTDGIRLDIDANQLWTEHSGRDILFKVHMTTAGVSGVYYYCYTYKRTDWLLTEGNPSDISDSIEPSTQDVDVNMIASTDPQVDKMVLYRTLVDEESPFYSVVELDNSFATISAATIAFVDSGPDTITDSGSGFVEAGFVAGDMIQVTNATQSANNIIYTIDSVVAGTITLITTDTVTTENADATEITLTAIGKLFSDSVASPVDLYELDNGVPPKSKYIKLHKDVMFYANCPDEEEGGSLVMWSKTSNAEQVPSTNYQYFDRDDGEEITGVASLGEYFFVFKPNKIGVLDTSSPEIWYLGRGVGCVAPWAILTFKDKVVFLAEDGWKATDGNDIWSLSENILGLAEDGYITIEEKENYSVAFYPEKEHFQFLINHSELTPKIIVGHFLVPLILKPTGISELVKQNIMGWTYHEYDYHTLTCVGNYTDGDGITRVIAGATDGYIYLLDSGTSDGWTTVETDGDGITTILRTDWLHLGVPRSITKTVRKGYLSYSAGGTLALELAVDVDFAVTNEVSAFTGGSVGVDDSINESFNMTGTGELFRFTFIETGTESFDLMGLTVQFRVDGIRGY